MMVGFVDLVHLSMLLRTNLQKRDAKRDPFNDEQTSLNNSFAVDLPLMQQKAIRWVQSSVCQYFR